MDELDLVRLTRPPVDDLGDDALARVRAAALGAAVDPPATDAEPSVALVELTPVAPSPARRRWRLAAAGLAAAVLVGGGLIVASQRRDRGGIAAPADDELLRRQLALDSWTRTIEGEPAPTDGGSTIGWGASRLTFVSDADGAITFESPCGVFVSRGYRIVDGALVLAEPLTSPEGGCPSEALNDATSDVIALLASRPAIDLSDCMQTGDLPDRASLFCGTLRLGSGAPFTRPRPPDGAMPTTTLLEPEHVPTIDELRGRTFALTSWRRADGTDVPFDQPVTLLFGPYLVARTPCTDLQADIAIEGDRLQAKITAMTGSDGSTVVCTPDADPQLVMLLLSTPRIVLSGARLVLTGDSTTAELTTGPLTTAAPTTVAGPLPTDGAHVPTIDELRGRTFEIVALRRNAMGLTLSRAPRITFEQPLVIATVCNSANGTASIGDGRLAITDYGQTLAGCAAEDDVVALLLGRPRITLAGQAMLLVSADHQAELREVIDGAVAPTTSVGLAPPSTFPTPTSPAQPTTLPAVPATLDALAGRQFQGPGPAGDVRFRLDADGTLAVSYGCNSGSGRASVADGRLSATELSITEMACGDGSVAEQQVYDLLLQRPALELNGSTLLVGGADLTLWLEEQFPRPLTQTRWITSGFVTPEYTGYAGLRQELTFSPAGRWTYRGRCATLTGSYERGDGTITFTLDPLPSPSTCAQVSGSDVEEPNLRALFQTTVTYSIVERSLRLVGPDGNGEMFLAAG